MSSSDNPIRIVGKWTFFVERKHMRFPEARILMTKFASILVRTPSLYAYKLELAYLWNSFSRGVTVAEIIATLRSFSKKSVPKDFIKFMEESEKRYLSNIVSGNFEKIKISETASFKESDVLDINRLISLKKIFARTNIPILDNRKSRSASISHNDNIFFPFEQELRDYQREAINFFCREAISGNLVLPCGSGKTLIAIGIMISQRKNSLIYVPSTTSLEQWKNEFKKWLGVNNIQGINGNELIITSSFQKIVILHYQSDFKIDIEKENIELLFFDEIHLLPTEMKYENILFSIPQRIGLTASFVRDDGYLAGIHNLVGPIRYEIPWKELQEKHYITVPECIEIRVPFLFESGKSKLVEDLSIAAIAQNPTKEDVLARILLRHACDHILIFSAYSAQLESIGKKFNIPIISGKTPVKKREMLFNQFRDGKISRLAVSQIGSCSLDLPIANVAVQVSGKNASRQEELQRIGRIMRKKEKNIKSFFYSLITENSCEEEFAAKRQVYLMEHGIPYTVGEYDEI